MKQVLTTEYEEFDSFQFLSEGEKLLIHEATNQTTFSYAPYSQFNVGAAALLASGNIIRGSNQENASYPICICAEQVVLSQCGAIHPRDAIVMLAISVRKHNGLVQHPISPCGACRQAMIEYISRQGKDFVLLLGSTEGKVIRILQASSLLPLSFRPSDL
jgi:cytidine deaminase